MFKHLIMLCPSLRDEGGHEFDYTKEVAQAALAAGTNVTTFVPATASRMVLPGQIAYVSPQDKLPRQALAKIVALITKLFFYFQTFHQNRKASTLFFVHTMSQKQLAIVAVAWMMAHSKEQALTLFLRHPIGTSLSDHLLLLILKRSSRFGVSFVSDSDLLAENLMPRLGCKIDTVPIPIAPLMHEAQRTNKEPVCSYFGARRKNKGFLLLPSLVEAANKINSILVFRIQAYAHRDVKPEVGIAEALAALSKHQNVDLIDRILSDKEFAELVSKTDVALLPYEADAYRYSTSGNFVMSAVARSVIVTTENTWMAHQAKKHKLTRVVLLPWQATASQVETAMKQAVFLLQQPDNPSPQEKKWCDNQTAKSLWSALSCTQPSAC